MNQYVIHSVVNKHQIPFPSYIDPIFLKQGSVVELLSENTFPYTSYKYLYKSETNKLLWPDLVRQRLMVYAASKFLYPDSTSGDNIFQLQLQDFAMLDVLMTYRHDSTSVSFIDSTGFNIVTDATSTVVFTNFSSLQTPLSKLIYLYLELKIYRRYDNYNNLNIISPCTLLETYFELRLVDEYFLFMSDREVSFEIECP